MGFNRGTKIVVEEHTAKAFELLDERMVVTVMKRELSARRDVSDSTDKETALSPPQFSVRCQGVVHLLAQNADELAAAGVREMQLAKGVLAAVLGVGRLLAYMVFDRKGYLVADLPRLRSEDTLPIRR